MIRWQNVHRKVSVIRSKSNFCDKFIFRVWKEPNSRESCHLKDWKKGSCRVLKMCGQSANRLFPRRNASFPLCSSFSKGVFGTAAIHSNWQQKYCSECWDNEWTISHLLERSRGGKKKKSQLRSLQVWEARLKLTRTFLHSEGPACPANLQLLGRLRVLCLQLSGLLTIVSQDKTNNLLSQMSF